MTPSELHDLVWAVIGAAIGAVLAPLVAWLVYWLRSLPGSMTGTWYQDVMDGSPDQPGRVVKRDRVTTVHVGDSIRGQITRVYPAAPAGESPRRWRFSGRYRDLSVFGHFWSLHHDNRSFGNIYLRKEGKDWVGYYTRTERGVSNFRDSSLRLEDHPLRWAKLTRGSDVPPLELPPLESPPLQFSVNEPAKPLAILDFDKTLYAEYAIVDFARFLEQRGLLAERTTKDMHRLAAEYSSHRIDRDLYARDTAREFYLGIQGLTAAEVSSAADEYWKQVPGSAWLPGARELVNLLAKSHAIVVISGSPHEVLEKVDLGVPIRELFATSGSIVAGRFTGEVHREYATAAGKEFAIERLQTKYLQNVSGSIAIGDSASDIPILRAVQSDHAFIVSDNESELDSELAEEAHINRWLIGSIPSIEAWILARAEHTHQKSTEPSASL